jgi:hypothetical protein
MARANGNRDSSERVDLFRGGSVVSSLPGAFGASLRETRITALLGYIIAQKPEAFREILNLKGDVLEIGIESDCDGDRADVEIVTTRGTCLIEAKCGATDPSRQARRYRADMRVLLTGLLAPERDGRADKIRYVSWQRMANHLGRVANGSGAPVKFLCGEIVRYLEEHNMVTMKEPVEVYARDVNKEYTLDLFLQAHLYHCWFARNSRLPEAQYFAPHFGWSLACKRAGVLQGISYVAKIEQVLVVDSCDDFKRVLSNTRGKDWTRTHQELLSTVKGRSWKRGDKKSILLLGQPRLVFNPPIGKKYLQPGSGFLIKHFFFFDDLFKAWQRQS